MTEKALPLLYLNMAGEMMYILDQRLKVSAEFTAGDEKSKSEKVLKDIILLVLGKSTLDEIFKTKMIPPKKNLKIVFEKLAHASIMRLNENSMDKLFDLMIMAVKYSMVKVTMAEQILTVSINHLQGIQDILPTDLDVRNAIEHAFTMYCSLYRPLSVQHWHLVRTSILQYLAGVHIKISLLLRDDRQSPEGVFVLNREDVAVQLAPDMDQVPIGTVIYYQNGKRVEEKDEHFEVKFKYEPYKNLPDQLNVPERSTDMGENWYKKHGSLRIQGGGGIGKNEVGYKAGNEMKFLESLMSRDLSTNKDLDSEIMAMSLFDDPTEEKNYIKESEEWYGKIMKIDATKNRKSLKSTIEEKTGGSRPSSADKKGATKKSKGAGLLELMDEAAARPPTAKPRRGTSTESSSVKPKSRSGSRPKERAPSASAPKRAGSAKKKAAAN